MAVIPDVRTPQPATGGCDAPEAAPRSLGGARRPKLGGVDTACLTLFVNVVEVSAEVAGTRARSRKIALLAGLLAQLEPSEVPVVVGFLSGVPRQGRVGVGYRTVHGIDEPPADRPALTVPEIDQTIAELETLTGSGSGGRRRALLAGVLGRATAAEGAFRRRLLTGELRQGALAGLMADAVAQAAVVPPEAVRRALMLSGDLSATAQLALTGGEPALR